jgi:hypothetical protein
MPEHVSMDREVEARALADALDEPVDGIGRDGPPRSLVNTRPLSRGLTSLRPLSQEGRSGIFLPKQFCDFARTIDEKLRHRTRFAAFQCDDADRRPSNRQVDS